MKDISPANDVIHNKKEREEKKMGRCPYLVFDLPEGAPHYDGKFYCKDSEHRLHQDELTHLCSCSYEDKFLTCEHYLMHEGNKEK